MKNFETLLNILNELKIVQKSMDWLNDIPYEVYHEYFELNDCDIIDNTYQERHRHHELSTVVFKILDRFVGVECVTDLYSEQSEVIDIYHTLKFFEMEPITITSYRKKK